MELRMHEIRRSILRKLSSSLSRSNIEPSRSHPVDSPEQSDPERFDRVLELWLDLQNAIQSGCEHVKGESGFRPWTCSDQDVREAWHNLTNPRNSLALERLYLQLGEGKQVEIVRLALQVCRERRELQGLI